MCWVARKSHHQEFVGDGGNCCQELLSHTFDFYGCINLVFEGGFQTVVFNLLWLKSGYDKSIVRSDWDKINNRRKLKYVWRSGGRVNCSEIN